MYAITETINYVHARIKHARCLCISPGLVLLHLRVYPTLYTRDKQGCFFVCSCAGYESVQNHTMHETRVFTSQKGIETMYAHKQQCTLFWA